MSQQSELRYRLGLYRELDDIVSTLRSLARMELIRLKRVAGNQQQAYADSLQALSLVAYFHPEVVARSESQARPVLLLLGSERGFCAGFNEQLVRAYRPEAFAGYHICTVGSRLGRRLKSTQSGQTGSFDEMAGPGTLDEVADCAQQLLAHWLTSPKPAAISLLCQDHQGVGLQHLYPVEPRVPSPVPASLRLQLPAAELYEELQWHCLYQGMVQHLLTSLLIENRQRLGQMERAKSHLEALSQGMQLDLNRLRQQEIVEEIEVLFAEPGSSHF